MKLRTKNNKITPVNKTLTTEQIRLTPFFENPLIPVGNKPSKKQNKELLIALDVFSKRKTFDDITVLDEFVNNNADSPWRGSIYLSIGRENFIVGKFSKALKAYETAWNILKTAEDFNARQIAERAFGELVKMEARLGRFEQLEKLFPQVEGRHLIGSNSELISTAKSGHLLMNHEPEVAFRCGSSAVSSILSALTPHHSFSKLFDEAKSTKKGMSLQSLFELSKKAGLNYQIAKRSTDAEILLPCVAHYKLNHYCAVTQKHEDLYKIEDETFGVNFSVWVSRETFEEEMSGYFLVPAGELPKGWEAISKKEAENVWGKGATETSDPNATSPCDEKAIDSCSQKGMAVHNMHLMLVSLNIQDTPLSYTPNRGAPINIELTYNQKEASGPAGFTHFNIGHKWTMNWLTYIIDNVNQSGIPIPGDVTLFVAGGGTYTFKQSGAGTFFPELYTQANLVRTSANSYTMTMPDGSKKVFEQTQVNSISGKRKLFLSKITGSDLNSYEDVTLNYDSTSPGIKLDSISDALGNQTTFEYAGNDPYLITKITDPYNRSCSLNYNTNNLLTQITDVIGLTSQFIYGRILQYLIVPNLVPHPFIEIWNDDFIEKMTTPYGDTSFSYTEAVPTLNLIGSWPGYWNRQYTLSIIGPDGGREVVEYHHDFTGLILYSDVEAPSGWDNSRMNFRNTFYWDKKTMQANPVRDYHFAKIYHFLHANYTTTSGILESIKNPLESRIWYKYNNQGSTLFLGNAVSKPNEISRIVDADNALGYDRQSYLYEYNSYGLITKKTDPLYPLGRITNYTYDSSNLNLLRITQNLGGGLTCKIKSFKYGDPNFPSKPTRIHDASGQPTTLSYNKYGQLETITNAKGEVTTLSYDNLLYLTEVLLPLSGSSKKIIFEYEVVNGKRMNRISSVTDTEGFTTHFEYDNFDRVTQIKYPDSTSEIFEYTLLDLTKTTDRTGQTKEYTFNNIRQLVRVVGGSIASGHAQEDINYQWCKCGKLSMISFGVNGLNRTEFFHDIQGRLEGKRYPAGSYETYEYYGRTSLLKNKIQQGIGHKQVTNYTYFVDNNVKAISYFDGTVPATRQSIMHPITFEYDAFFDRITKVTDEFVNTSYFYFPVLPNITTGALKLQCIKSVISQSILPFANALEPQIDFWYDELGREVNRNLNTITTVDPLNSGHHSAGIGMLTNTYALPYTQQLTYDALGRIIQKDNITGSHVFSYEGLSNRLAEIAHSGFAKLKTQFDWYSLIPNLKSITNTIGVDVLSKNEYVYNSLNEITRWDQTKQRSLLSYIATKDSINFEYDTLGQLVKEERIDSRYQRFISENEYDNYGNRVRVTNSEYSFGALNVSLKGTTSYNPDNKINWITPDIALPAQQQTPFYDDYGQIIFLNQKGYEWDAAGRIKKITHWDETPGNRPENATEFIYDSFNRIVKITEKKYNVPDIEVFFIWCFNELLVQLTPHQDIRYYTEEGFMDVVPGNSATNVTHNSHTFLYTKDHLGSICELVGNGTASTLRYNYDRWGVRTSEVIIKPQNAFTPESVPLGFCGYFYHERTGLYLTKYRAYKPEIGRWLSKDPIGETGGLNLYRYCGNNPVNFIDSSGLIKINVVDEPLMLLPLQNNVPFSGDPEKLVSDILLKANGELITEITFYVHGCGGSMFGSDEIGNPIIGENALNSKKWQNALMNLGSNLGPDSMINFSVCDLGMSNFGEIIKKSTGAKEVKTCSELAVGNPFGGFSCEKRIPITHQNLPSGPFSFSL